MVLRWLIGQLSSGRRHVDCSRSPQELGEAFRTDAKGGLGTLVIGGWKCLGGVPPSDAQWFSLTITEGDAPWLFKGGDSSRVIAAGELLATLVAVRLFLPNQCPGKAWFRLTGTTDNLGNAYVVKKLLTTKRPLGALLMQLTCDLYDRQLWLDLQWVRRELNEEADALTNQDFSRFNPLRRLPVTWSEVTLPIAQSLLEAEPDFQSRLESLKAEGSTHPGPASEGSGTASKKKRTALEPW